MKHYMAIFLGSAEAFAKYKAMAEEMRKQKDKEGMEAWMKWAQKYQSAIVNMGSPLGKTKKVDKSGVSDTRNELGAWTIVQAESHEKAAKMFENHPHFTVFPGDRVEVMEVLPMPKM
jgi:hypothetical protein